MAVTDCFKVCLNAFYKLSIIITKLATPVEPGTALPTRLHVCPAKTQISLSVITGHPSGNQIFKASSDGQRIFWLHRIINVFAGITETCLSNILKILSPENENFQIKENSDTFHVSAQNINCGYSLEPQSMF